MRKQPLNALGRRLGPVILLVLILTLGHNATPRITCPQDPSTLLPSRAGPF